MVKWTRKVIHFSHIVREGWFNAIQKCHYETMMKLSSGFESNLIQNCGQMWTNLFTATLVCLRNRRRMFANIQENKLHLKLGDVSLCNNVTSWNWTWAMWHMEYFTVRMTWTPLFYVFLPFAKYFCHWRGVILPNANEIRSPTNVENCVHYNTCMFEKRKVVVYTLNIRARPSLWRIVLCTIPYYGI